MTSADKYFACGLPLFGALCAYLLGVTPAALGSGALLLGWLLIRWQSTPETQRRAASQVAGFHRLDDQQIVTRRSLGVRVFCGSLAAIFLLCAVVMSRIGRAYSSSSEGLFVEAAGVAFYTAVSLLSWWAAGPHDLCIDLYRRTYQMTAGFPFFPRVRHGTLDEVATVCICKGGGNGSKSQTAQTRLWIKLLWKQPRRSDVFLCRCGSQEAAEAVVRRVTDAMGLPDDGEAALGALWFRNARLRRCDGDGLAFHKSLALRVTMGLLGKAITIACLILSGAVVFGGGGLHIQTAATNPAWLFVDALGLLCLRAAGPQDLEVDLNARTYLYRFGFPGFPLVVTGSLSDIIALNTTAGGDGGGFQVRLVWAQPCGRRVAVGEFPSRQEADAHRRFLADRLGLAAV